MTKGAKEYSGVKIAPSTNGVRRIWNSTCKKMKLDHQLTPYTRINSKWIKDLNVNHDTIKILEGNIGGKFQISHIAMFLPTSPRTMKIKEKINKWDYIK